LASASRVAIGGAALQIRVGEVLTYPTAALARKIEIGLKAIAAREGETMATIVRAALRATIASAAAGSPPSFVGLGQPRNAEMDP
jgi:hypothetical protein